MPKWKYINDVDGSYIEIDSTDLNNENDVQAYATNEGHVIKGGLYASTKSTLSLLDNSTNDNINT